MELSVVLCDDGHIRELNAEWRGKDEPTDVLSFEMPEDELDELPAAEVGLHPLVLWYIAGGGQKARGPHMHLPPLQGCLLSAMSL